MTQAPAFDPSAKGASLRSQWAALAIRQNASEIQDGIEALPSADINKFEATRDTLFDGDDRDPHFKVGIIGAGCAGLFTAMIFDYLKDNFNLNLEYEILEANKDNRLGGRLYTYKFPDKANDPPVGKHEYYDVGAMRFPENDIMKRTFSLFDKLDMKKHSLKIDPNFRIDNVEDGQLIPYYLSCTHQPSLYNGIQVVSDPEKKKFFSGKDFKITGLPKGVDEMDPDGMINNQISDYRTAIINSPKEFWDRLMSQGDRYSVRQYLSLVANYDYNTIEFLETMNFGNRWYDQAFSEMLIDTMEFDYGPSGERKPVDWWCVLGGAQNLCRKMAGRVKGPIEFERKVTEMSYAGSFDIGDIPKIDVTVLGEEEKRTYDAVFNSATLGAQQHMKLEGLNLNWGTKQAIRSLGYGASCKVGIRFKTLWWMDDKVLGKDRAIKKGGLAHTDLSIRCCVYPSYNIEDPIDQPGVLLVSYTWSQEAEKIGALINRGSPDGESELKELLFHDLARLHTDNEEDYKRLYARISTDHLDHYAYNWYSDPYTVGAFAFFGPGQFQNMWQWITRSNGSYVIVGEAASAHHAWVVGALESAVRGVYQFLYAHSKHSLKNSNAVLAYAHGEMDNAWPYGPLPAEYNRTEDIKHIADDVEPKRGDLARQQVAIETWRMQNGGDQLNPKEVSKSQVSQFIPTAT